MTPLRNTDTTEAPAGGIGAPNLPDGNDEMPDLVSMTDESTDPMSEQLDQLILDMDMDLPDSVSDEIPEATALSSPTTIPSPTSTSTIAADEEVVSNSNDQGNIIPEPQQSQPNSISSIVGMFRRMSSRRGSM